MKHERIMCDLQVLQWIVMVECTRIVLLHTQKNRGTINNGEIFSDVSVVYTFFNEITCTGSKLTCYLFEGVYTKTSEKILLSFIYYTVCRAYIASRCTCMYAKLLALFLSTLLLLLFAGTIFCEFLRFGKNRKIKYPKSLSFDCFRVVFSSFVRHHELKKWRLMTSMIVGVLRAFVLTGERVQPAPSGMFHVDLHEDCMYFSPDNTSITVGFKVELSPFARSRKI